VTPLAKAAALVATRLNPLQRTLLAVAVTEVAVVRNCAFGKGTGLTEVVVVELELEDTAAAAVVVVVVEGLVEGLVTTAAVVVVEELVIPAFVVVVEELVTAAVVVVVLDEELITAAVVVVLDEELTPADEDAEVEATQDVSLHSRRTRSGTYSWHWSLLMPWWSSRLSTQKSALDDRAAIEVDAMKVRRVMMI
jgi:hypothetical protein